MKVIIKILSVFILTSFLTFFGVPENWNNFPVSSKIYKARATNYLSNPSFTGGTTNWTLTNSSYDSSYYQDSAGSIKTHASGMVQRVDSYTSQTISTNISSSDTVKLSLYWSKQCLKKTCSINRISFEIARPSYPDMWTMAWDDTSKPAIGSPTSWATVTEQDISNMFNESGEYKIRIKMEVMSGTSASAEALAWVDNVVLDVVSSTAVAISVSDGNVNYGNLPLNSTQDTTNNGINDSQTVTNDGSVFTRLEMKGQNSVNWTLSSSAGNENYTHKVCSIDCDNSPTWTALTTNYQTVATFSAGQNRIFDFQVGTPTATNSSGTQQNVDIMILATE